MHRLAGLAVHQRQLLATVRLGDAMPHRDGAKPWLQRYLELTYTWLRWGSASPIYYAQAVHKRGASVRRDFLAYSAFRALRDQRNLTDSEGLEGNRVLRDKAAFQTHFGHRGLPVPSTLLRCSDRRLDEAVASCRQSLTALNPPRPFPQRVFFKPTRGIKGLGNFAVTIREDGFEASDGAPRDTGAILEGDWLVQELLDQHPAAARLHPSSLNTLRIITYRSRSGGIRVFLSYLRIGLGGRVVDNAAAGGVIVPVDLESGQLAATGLLVKDEHATPLAAHPTSGIAFGGHLLPATQQCLAIAIRAHEAVPALHSVGWDLALTPGGPVLLEGNDDWGGISVMWLVPDFRSRFERLLAGAPGLDDTGSGYGGEDRHHGKAVEGAPPVDSSGSNA